MQGVGLAGEDMKSRNVILGIALVFGSFVLMMVSMGFEAWRSGLNKERAQAVRAVEKLVLSEVPDLSNLEIITASDGAPMVLVPEGPFLMGSPPVEGDPDEIPQRMIYLSEFYIDLYEVVFKNYNDFVNALRRPRPVFPFFDDDVSLITQPDLPAVGLSWRDARDYCEWVGKRLPTEAEWEKAARGERGFQWSWGNTFGESMANTSGDSDGYQYASSPGQFEEGRSSYGLYDTTGNVAEWVADWYDPGYYLEGSFRDPPGPVRGEHRIYRGGSWDNRAPGVRAAIRYAASPHQMGAGIGFRCAMDAS